MPSQRETRIIVLHLTKYGEKSLVVQALDSERGRTGFFLRGAAKGRGSQGHFHSLSILDVVATPGRGEMEFLSEFDRPYPLDSLRSDPYKSAIALFISELLYRCLLDGAMDPDMFDFLQGQILQLEALEGSAANFHLCFLVDFCCAMGFRPKDNWSASRPLFQSSVAEFISEDTLAPTFSKEESLLLHNLLSLPRQDALALPLTGERRGAFAQKMAEYLSCHLSLGLNIRSLKVLHELFR